MARIFNDTDKQILLDELNHSQRRYNGLLTRYPQNDELRYKLNTISWLKAIIKTGKLDSVECDEADEQAFSTQPD